MDAAHFLSRAGSLVGDPSRAAMLWSLLGGEARPASELAMLANVSPQTASNHLRLLIDGKFLRVESLGRNKFYRLNGPLVGVALESLAAAAHGKPATAGIAQHSAPELVFARTCYDHLAGELGVAIRNRLEETDCLRQHGDDYRVSTAGEKFLRGLGIDLDAARTQRRRFAYACLDWSHRVPHLGGALGAALLNWMFAQHLLAQRKSTRAVRLTETGQKCLAQHFAIRLNRTGTAIPHFSRAVCSHPEMAYLVIPSAVRAPRVYS
jgi:DNA-binding transcriptional ArsR family regulator